MSQLSRGDSIAKAKAILEEVLDDVEQEYLDQDKRSEAARAAEAVIDALKDAINTLENITEPS